MTVYEQRQTKVAAIIREKFHDGKNQFAEAVDVAPSTVSRWFMKGDGHKNIGEKIARKIESRLKLGKYSLDSDDPVPMPERRVQPIFGDDHFARKLARIWEEIPDDAKGQILAFAQVTAITKAAAAKKA
jgi:hypothetical protein